MTDLNKMWQELERYQPYADRRGFGEAWLRMTTERTQDAAWAALAAAAEAAAAGWVAATYGAGHEAKAAQRAIKHIREVIAQEQT